MIVLSTVIDLIPRLLFTILYNVAMLEEDIHLSGHHKVSLTEQNNGDLLMEWPKEIHLQLANAAPNGSCILTMYFDSKNTSVGLSIYPEQAWEQAKKIDGAWT